MNKSPMLLIVTGLLLLAVGAIMEVAGGAPRADAALAQACRNAVQVKQMGADLVTGCNDAAFATAMTTTDATAASRAISAANSSEVRSNMGSMLLIGLGLMLTIGGVVLRHQRRP